MIYLHKQPIETHFRIENRKFNKWNRFHLCLCIEKTVIVIIDDIKCNSLKVVINNFSGIDRNAKDNGYSAQTILQGKFELLVKIFLLVAQHREHTRKKYRNGIMFISLQNLHESSLKKGFILKNQKKWAETVRQIRIVPVGINSSLAKRCELKNTKISCLSVFRVVL